MYLFIILTIYSLIYSTEQYWGWCKHQYREIYKERLDQAKKAVHECLDACPADVIQWFFNRSWQFMDAYRMGLTGKAAEWVVHKQKSHWRVGQHAMLSIEAVLNTN